MTSPHAQTTSPHVHLPSVRHLWQGMEGHGAATVLALCDEIERLRLDLDSARSGEAYWKRDAAILRAEKWQMRRDVARAIGADQ